MITLTTTTNYSPSSSSSSSSNEVDLLSITSSRRRNNDDDDDDDDDDWLPLVRRRGAEEPLLPASSLRPTTSDDEQEEEEEEERERRQQQNNDQEQQQTSFSTSRINNKNSNIRLTLIYTFFAFAGRSIWNQSVLATFVYLIRDEDPASVGYITAIMGISNLLVSIPSGYYADHYKRDVMILRFASIVGFIASMVSILACILQNYLCLLFALTSWGMYWGMSNPPIMALFADSIIDGQRSYYFTQRSVVITLSNATGPIIALIMFVVLGDHWTINECSIVMAGGQLISFPAIIILCFFRDDIESGREGEDEEEENEEGESEEEQQLEQQHQNGFCEENDTNGGLTCLPQIQPQEEQQDNPARRQQEQFEMEDCEEDEGQLLLSLDERPLCVASDEKNNDGRRHNTSEDSDNDGDNDGILHGSSSAHHKCCCFRSFSIPKHRLSPLCVALADLTSGLGSGMSIRYFPIFFYHNLQLNPIQVQILYSIFPFLKAIIMKFSQQILVKKYKYGRAIVSVGLRWLGIAFMILMVIAARQQQDVKVQEEQQQQQGDDGSNNNTTNHIHNNISVWFICMLYVLRTGFINSTPALTRSLLMDNVPQSERAKWSSLESVTVFGWSGSAALGGVLVNKMNGDVLPLFIVTAFIQFLSTLWLIPLIGAYDQERDDPNHNNEDADEGGSITTIQQTATTSPTTTTVAAITTTGR